jgi:ubiquinol-cytochrome c reductase cytochrome b subunit
MLDWLSKIGAWLDARLQVGGTIRETMAHAVPRNTASWWYVFGSATFVLLMMQFAT